MRYVTVILKLCCLGWLHISAWSLVKLFGHNGMHADKIFAAVMLALHILGAVWLCIPLIWNLPRERITCRGAMVLPILLVSAAAYFALLWKNVLWSIRFFRQGDMYHLFSCVSYIVEALSIPVLRFSRTKRQTE